MTIVTKDGSQDSTEGAPRPRLALFNVYSGGHNPEHVAHLVRYWRDWNIDGLLEVAAPESLRSRHPDLKPGRDPRISWFAIPESDGGSLLRSALHQWTQIRSYVRRRRPGHVLLMHMDHAQPGLALGLRFPFDVHLSGILFRPSLHYPLWQADRPGIAARFQSVRKKALLRAALKNPHLDTVFSLDSLAVPHIVDLVKPRCRVQGLPEPLAIERRDIPRASIRNELGIEDRRHVFLFFGVLDDRKGLTVLLDSMRLLGSETANRISVVLAGSVPGSKKDDIRQAVRSAESAGIQLIVRDEFIPYDLVQDYFRMADCILAPYQQHVGSSGIIVRAAAESRPVISQSYGLMGRLTETLRLGVTCDSRSPRALADALTRCVRDPVKSYFDPASAMQFAAENTAEAFARTLFARIVSAEELPSPANE